MLQDVIHMLYCRDWLQFYISKLYISHVSTIISQDAKDALIREC